MSDYQTGFLDVNSIASTNPVVVSLGLDISIGASAVPAKELLPPSKSLTPREVGVGLTAGMVKPRPAATRGPRRRWLEGPPGWRSQ